MLIYVLVLEGVFDIGLAALTDVTGIANELSQMEGSATQIELRLVAVRRRVRTAQRLTVPVISAAGLATPDCVLVPALGAKMPGPLAQALGGRDVVEAGTYLRQWAQAGASIGAACTSTFVLAESGLLDGHRATTSWWLSAMFRDRYPQIILEESRMLVNSGRYTTAGAALAHLDLVLAVVRGLSPTLAALCGRYLLIEPRASQAVFVIPDHVAHTDAVVQKFERWARARLAQGFDLQDAAHCVGASERTLGRRLQTVLGKSPMAYFQDLRVEQAVHLIQTTRGSIDQIATTVGYANGTTLRTLLRRKLGRGVREIRERKSGPR